jgi:hypothetical protein
MIALWFLALWVSMNNIVPRCTTKAYHICGIKNAA